MSVTQPMLAGKCSSLDRLVYPVLATPKLDGIRCLVLPDSKGKLRVLSRNFKPIPNDYIRRCLEALDLPYLDGELMLESPTASFQDVSSAIMSHDGEPNFVYRVFDHCEQPNAPYAARVRQLAALRDFLGPKHRRSAPVELVLPVTIGNQPTLEAFESDCLAVGYEGVMVRSQDGPYKCGRSTEREGYLLKIKRFVDGEAVVIGCEELMHNDNSLDSDAFGRAKRSSHKANLRPAGVLGALVVSDVTTGVTFNIGTGFDADTRKNLWRHRAQIVGLVVKYKSQPTGVKEAPRFPVFLGFRSPLPF